jgi:hypothetical protein
MARAATPAVTWPIVVFSLRFMTPVSSPESDPDGPLHLEIILGPGG